MFHYIRNCKDELIQLLLNGLKNVTIEDDDDCEVEWGVAMSAGCCLEQVS